MAFKVSIDIQTPTDANPSVSYGKVQLLDALSAMELAIPNLIKVKFHQRPDLDYNFDVETSLVGKALDQIVHVTPADPLASQIIGTVTGTWTAREFVAIIEVRRRLIELLAAINYTDFTYNKLVV